MTDIDSQIQRTLVLLKPDAVARCLAGRILQRFEDALLKIIGVKMVQMDRSLTREHYRDALIRHGPDVFAKADAFMRSCPVIAIVLEGVEAIAVVRKMVGDTYPGSADPGTIRGDLAHQSRRYGIQAGVAVANLVHSSENPADARREIALWFLPEELHNYTRPSDVFAF